VTVEVRPAATVMLVRDTPDDRVEVLLLQRHPDLVFVAGAHVFPGGAVDPADSTAASASVAIGLDDERASGLLDVPAGGLAYWVAAVRETFEEAGLLLATTLDGGDPWLDPQRAARLHDARPDVEAGRVTLAELCRREGLRLELGPLRSFGRWITPLGAPRRYDTRFFVAPAPRRPEVRVDEREAVAAEWVEPEAALDRFRAGEIDLILPTERSLAALAEHRTTADLFAWLDTAPAEIDDHGGRRVGSPGVGSSSEPRGPVAGAAPLPVGDL
jgi:8-oxo-dGTP pyrophosphatase MutT (NUDIX family)